MSPYSDSLSLRLPYPVKLATERKSLTHYTKGTQSPLHDGLSTSPSCRADFRLASRAKVTFASMNSIRISFIELLAQIYFIF
jgi:hypothetical protein